MTEIRDSCRLPVMGSCRDPGNPSRPPHWRLDPSFQVSCSVLMFYYLIISFFSFILFFTYHCLFLLCNFFFFIFYFIFKIYYFLFNFFIFYYFPISDMILFLLFSSHQILVFVFTTEFSSSYLRGRAPG